MPVAWLESSEPSYILYTSGTTGKPKGVQRDTGGYAVALASSMEYLFNGKPGDTYFCTSDIGWVVGHSYIIYGPLIGGQATILYEGTPVRPDGAILWKLVEKYRVNTLLGADRGARAQAPGSGPAEKARPVPLRAVYLAGEPLDEPTAQWISQGWASPSSTTTGRPNRAGRSCRPSPAGKRADAFRQSSFPVYGFDARIVSETTGEDLGPDQKGVVAIMPPLPPGAMSTIWGDDERFVQTYFTSIPGRLAYSTFDWGWWTRTATGSSWAAPTTSSTWPAIAWARARSRNPSTATRPSPSAPWSAWPTRSRAGGHGLRRAEESAGAETQEGARQLEGDIMRLVEDQLGAVAKPARIRFVGALPKTRSGKVLRRAIVAVRGTRSRRPDHHRRSHRPGTD